MGKFVVFNKVEWKAPIKSTLLTTPVLRLDVSFPDKDLADMTKKHRAAFDKSFKEFDKEFHKLGTSKIKEVQSAVEWTEERIKQKDRKEAEEVVETANKMLVKAFKTFESQIRKLAQKCYDRAIVQSYKAMKMRLVRATAKATAIITIIALLTLTAAALTIAASVASGGAVGWIVLGAIATTLGAVATVVAAVGAHWSKAENVIKKIKADIQTLQSALDKLSELEEFARRTGTTTTKDKIQKEAAIIKGKLLSNLDKHVGQLDKFIFKTREELKKQKKDLEKISAKIAKSGDKDLEKKSNKLIRQTIQSERALAKIEIVKAEAKHIQALWDKHEIPKLNKFEKALRELAEAATIIKAMVKGGKDVGMAAKDLVPA